MPPIRPIRPGRAARAACVATIAIAAIARPHLAAAQPKPQPPASAAPSGSVPETATDCRLAPGAPTRINATATGARRVAGNVTFTLYGDRASAFLAHGGSIAIERIPLTATTAQACFAVSRPGVYAIAIYHDENDNHHFDRSLIGLPVEGYGFTNDAPVFMAPPSFAAARITVPPGGAAIRIRLRY